MLHPFHCVPQLLELVSQLFILSELKAGLLQRQFFSLEAVHELLTRPLLMWIATKGSVASCLT